MTYINYDVEKFKQILKDNDISIRSIGNPENPNYCGITSRTIGRANASGTMSLKTYTCLNSIIDISSCIIEQSNTNYKELIKEYFRLKNRLEEIEFILKKSVN